MVPPAKDSKQGKTSVPPASGLVVQPELGQRLRELREESGLALHEVADQTGVSKSFLSLVEKGQSDLSVNRFMRICEFYGVKPSTFLRSAGASDGQAAHYLSPSEGSEIITLRPSDAATSLLPALTIYKPGAKTEMFQHSGDEFVFVVEGRVRLVFGAEQGDEAILLRERESYYFSAERPHRFENPDKRRKAVKLSVQSEDRW